MSPATTSPAARPRPRRGATLADRPGREQPILWCATSTTQVSTALPWLHHLLQQHHRVTLATHRSVWRAATEDPPDERTRSLVEDLATGGLRVVHPQPADATDLRGVLHSLHRRKGKDLTGALLRDPRMQDLAARSLVVWPGTSRPVELDAVTVLTGDEARKRLGSLLNRSVVDGGLSPRAVTQLATDLPDVVTPRQQVDAASALLQRSAWTGGTHRLLRMMGDLADRDLSTEDMAALAGLTFHRTLHADSLSSPLVEDPDSWLAPLRSTAAWRELTVEDPRPTTTTRPSCNAPRVALLPGTYGRFERPVVQALEAAGCTVDVIEPDDLSPGRLSRLARPESLAAVRSLLEEGDHQLSPEVFERLRSADVIWAEWADLPAVWASHLAAPHQRMVVRLHSLDTLDPWLHLLRWSSVDALVAVGAPVARVAVEALGTRLDLPPVHVIGHVLDDHWFEVPSTEDAHRRLVMVKWGRRVKDPLRAVEILARLREHDPTWRLRLIGDDLRDAGEKGPYTRKFARRIEEDDVRDALEFVPHTDDVAGHLAGCGFVLSTSRRESFHLGVVEGAAAGCVPVVRDWPVFRRHGGARDVLPPHWVVDTGPDGVDAAVERILAHADRPAWEAGSATARQDVRDHFDTQDTLRRLAAVALDRPDIPS